MKNILQKLQSIDINDINFAIIKDRITEKPEVFPVIVLIVATILTSVYTVGNIKNKTKKLEQEITKLEDKTETVQKGADLQNNYLEFIDSFPPTLVNEMVSETLSNFAIENDVRIITFSPAQVLKDDYSTRVRISLNIVSEYNNLIDFFKDIESSSYALRIGKWSGQLSSQRNRKKRKIDLNEKIESKIEIETVKLTVNEK